MRTTVDIPDETYRELRMLAAERGTTVRQIVLEGIELAKHTNRKRKKRFMIPTIPSKAPGKLHLTNEQIYDIIDFP